MSYLPILTYHRLLGQSPDRRVDPKRISVSVGQFRGHLKWLKRLGYTTLSLDRYPELLLKGEPYPPRSFAITFDDGYEEVLTLALPLLKEFGYTATVFAVAGQLGGRNAWDNGETKLLSQEHYRTLRRAGMTIGAHTSNHVHLPQVSPEVAQHEIVDSKSRLEETLGEAVTLFAYPYGEYNSAVEQIVQQAGFAAAFATDRAPASHAGHLFHLRRVVIFPRTNIWEVIWKVQGWYPAYQDWKRRAP